MEGDERHVQLLMQEWSMQQRKNVDTPISRAGQESIHTVEELKDDEARRSRGAIAPMNYMAQNRPDLSVAPRVMSQYMSKPREGIVPVIKRAIRYLKQYLRCRVFVSNSVTEKFEIIEWSDSDWANDPTTRSHGVVVTFRSTEWRSVTSRRPNSMWLWAQVKPSWTLLSRRFQRRQVWSWSWRRRWACCVALGDVR